MPITNNHNTYMSHENVKKSLISVQMDGPARARGNRSMSSTEFPKTVKLEQPASNCPYPKRASPRQRIEEQTFHLGSFHE